ncbi:VWA domain-containing protein [Rhabdothermincola sediminis]|uniref:VWA domain-containing protein n=1 Tax=Rhabdothermincola sediminis TaxID=2751370 RepID=UPI001AA03BFC|nr:VWA domain-containing protein [Rhabdothermincola sediminis]
MTFLEPQRLWLLLGVAALVGGYVALQWRRRAYTVKFTNLDLLASVAPRRPGWRRHLPAVGYLLAAAALVLALAQPSREERVPRERATIVMAIDVSLSMQATDVAPTRIEAAKDAAKVFLDILPPKINVGLVAFNGNASLKVPPTTDRDRVKAAIDDLELGERTAIGEAIFTSLDALRQVPPDDEGTQPPARIVLMSDGTTTDGRSNEMAAEAARQAGVPVSTIAFGTDRGTITVPEEPLPIRVPVDRPALRAIADATGGKFYSAGSEQQLTEVYENIGSSVGYVTEPREITTWFVAGALVLLAITGAMSLVWFSRLP